ncbi:MAG: tetratricopeptide repeat protein, partial [bacterium]
QARPDYPYALQGLAKIHNAKGEVEAAIQKWLRAYDLAPDHAFMEALAPAYRATGQHATAEVLTESVLEAFRQHEAQGWNVNLEFARFCAEQNTHTEDALQRIEREFARRPNHLDVLETYAWLLYRDNRPAEAAPLLERVLQTNPRNARLHYRAGMIDLRLGRPEQAQTHFESALSIYPESAMAKRALQRLSSDRLRARLQKTAPRQPAKARSQKSLSKPT